MSLNSKIILSALEEEFSSEDEIAENNNSFHLSSATDVDTEEEILDDTSNFIFKSEDGDHTFSAPLFNFNLLIPSSLIESLAHADEEVKVRVKIYELLRARSESKPADLTKVSTLVQSVDMELPEHSDLSTTVSSELPSVNISEIESLLQRPATPEVIVVEHRKLRTIDMAQNKSLKDIWSAQTAIAGDAHYVYEVITSRRTASGSSSMPILFEKRMRQVDVEKERSFDIFHLESTQQALSTSSFTLKLFMEQDENLAPFNLFMRTIEDVWLSRVHDQKAHNFLQTLSILKGYAFQWSKRSEGYEVSQPVIDSSILLLLRDFIKRNCSHTRCYLICCCLIGMLARSEQEKIEAASISRILHFLVNSVSTISVEDELADPEYIEYFQAGVQFMLDSSKLTLVERFTALALTPFMDAIQLDFYQNEVRLQPKAAELAFNESLIVLRRAVLNEANSTLWISTRILGSLIKYAPNFASLCRVLKGEKLNTQASKELVFKLLKEKIKEFENDKLGEDEIQCVLELLDNPALQSEELVCALLQSKVTLGHYRPLALGYAILLRCDKGLKLTGTLCETVRTFILTCSANSSNFNSLVGFIDRILKLRSMRGSATSLLEGLAATKIFTDRPESDTLTLIIQNENTVTSPSLQQFLRTRIHALVEHFATSSDKSLLVDVFNIIYKHTKSIELRFKLLLLLHLKSKLTPDVNCVLSHPLWYSYIRMHLIELPYLKETSMVHLPSSSKLQDVTKTAVKVLFDIFCKIIDRTCPIGDLGIVLQKKQTALKLSYLMGDIGFDEEMLNRIAVDYAEFEQGFDCLQAVINICSPYPCYEIASLKETVTQLRKHLHGLSFKNVHEVFLKIPLRDHLGWFRAVRFSELFLKIWNNTSLTLKGKYNIVQIGKVVIPLMKQNWRDLYMGIHTKTITFKAVVEQLVNSIPSERFRDEISILASTNSSDTSSKWIEENADLLKFCERVSYCRQYYSSVQQIIQYLVDTQKLGYKDEKVALLMNSFKQLDDNWSKSTLANISTAREFVEFFDGVSKEQLVFIDMLVQNKLLLSWLKGQRSQEEFMQVVSICKGYSDDAKVLESLSSLSVVRFLLGDLLYTFTHKSVSSVISSISTMPVQQSDGINHLTNLAQYFPILLKVFETKTKSSGIQSLYDLNSIIESGCYLLRTSAIVCELDQGLHTTRARWSVEQLIDLRNKITLAEIPEDIEGKWNLKHKISLFARQITALCSIRDSLKYLDDAGHPDFQENYSDKIQAFSNSLSNRAKEMKEIVEKWSAITKDLRTEYYFINLFSLKQILRIITILSNLSAASDPVLLAELLSYLKIGDSSIEIQEAATIAKTWASPSSNARPEDVYVSFANWLTSIFSARTFTHREISCSFAEGCASYVAELKQHLSATKLAVAFYDKLDMQSAVITLFTSLSRLPEPEEVLVCSSDMIPSMLEKFVFRWMNAKKYGRKHTHYVVMHFERLSQQCQTKFVNAVKRVVLDGEALANSTNLIVLSDVEAEGALSGLSSYFVPKWQVLSLSTLRKVYQVLTDYCFEILCVTGDGKTHEILRKAKSRSMEYRLVSINEINSDLDSLFRCTVEPKKPVAFHLDVSHLVDVERANSLLFQLVYLGVIQNKKGKVFQRQKHYAFYIEIANSIDATLFNRIKICSLLPGTTITPSAETYDQCRCTLSFGFDNSAQITLIQSKEVQLVSKILKALAQNYFRTAVGVIVDPSAQPDLDSRECFKLLSRFSGFRQLSFTLLHSFVQLLHQHFLSLINFEMLKLHGLRTRQKVYFLHEFISKIVADVSLEVGKSTNSFKNEGESSTSLLMKFIKCVSEVKTWEKGPRSVVIFSESKSKNTIDVVSRDKAMLDLFDEQVVKSLNSHGIQVCITSSSDENKLVAGSEHVLKKVLSSNPISPLHNFSNYVITVDHMVKITAILQRMKHNLPIVLMGDSGIGKRKMFEYITNLLNLHSHKLRITGGTSYSELEKYIRDRIQEAQQSSGWVIVFLDQANSSYSCMGLLKQIVIDRVLDSQLSLPSNLKVIASIQPYYQRVKTRARSDSGVKYSYIAQQACGKTIYSDGLEKLLYRVHPVSMSVLEHVKDFGLLSPETEKLYIASILRSDANFTTSPEQEKIASMLTLVIHQSHIFIRSTFKEHNAVTLRDVSRAFALFAFFGRMLSQTDVGYPVELLSITNLDTKMRTIVKKSIILALSVCYYYRLDNHERTQYTQMIKSTLDNVKEFSISDEKEFLTILLETQQLYAKHMKIPPGISLNGALSENIFMICVSILNKIPIFLVAKSGSSKSLAMEIVNHSLVGESSSNEFLRMLPAVELFPLQCSTSTKPEQLIQTFKAARRYAKNASISNTIVTVLLNEVGLLSDSPFDPLQVLNKELEEQLDIAIVGLSNYALDPSIANKALYLTRGTPSPEELKKSFVNIAASQQMEAALKPLADAFTEIYTNSDLAEFYGMRDFYYMLKHLNRNASLTNQLLLQSVLRNFGGKVDAVKFIINSFFSALGLTIKQEEIEQLTTSRHVMELIRENLQDTSARHLLLITNSLSCLSMLLDCKVLDSQKTTVIFGAETGENDICSHIQIMKKCMVEGHTVVLVDCEHLYDSLYELFNLQYVEQAGKRFVNLSIGIQSKLCVVHKAFRVILISDEKKVKNLSTPLLNRFEKQYISNASLFSSPKKRELVSRLEGWCNLFSNGSKPKCFVGYNHDLLHSLTNTLLLSDENENIEHMYHKAIDYLLWICSVDGICRAQHLIRSDSCIKIYFKQQEHRNLESLLNFMTKNREKGFLLQAATYSPASANLESLVRIWSKTQDSYNITQTICTNDLSMPDIADILQGLISEAILNNDNKMLLGISCDYRQCSLNKIRYTKFLCEKLRNSNLSVVFVIHVTPNSDTTIPVEIDTRWQYVFLDELTSVVPDVYSLLSSTLEDHLHQIDTMQIVRANFRKSVATLRYANSSLTQLSQRIAYISYLLDNESFTSILLPKITSIVIDYFSKENTVYWCDFVASNTEKFFHKCYNFHSAVSSCVEKMITKAFTLLLADLDQNSNLHLLYRLLNDQQPYSGQLAALWFQLWKERNTTGILLAKASFGDLENKVVHVHNDGSLEHVFHCRFPFSAHVCKFIHGLKGLTEHSKQSLAKCIEHHVELTMPCISKLPKEALLEYIYDYVHFYGLTYVSLSEEQQFLILSKLLQTQPSNSIAEIQAFYWKEERRLQAYFIILEALPTIIPPFLHSLSNAAEIAQQPENIDYILLNHVYAHLDPSNKYQPEDPVLTYTNWISSFNAVRVPLEVIASLQAVSPAATTKHNITEKWDKFIYYKEFIIKLAIPLKMSYEKSVELWTAIRDTKPQNNVILYSLQKVIDFLKFNIGSRANIEMAEKCCALIELFIKDFILKHFTSLMKTENNILALFTDILSGNDSHSFSSSITIKYSPLLKKQMLQRMLVHQSATNELLKRKNISELSAEKNSTTLSNLELFATIYQELYQKLVPEELATYGTSPGALNIEKAKDILKLLQKFAIVKAVTMKTAQLAVEEHYSKELFFKFESLVSHPEYKFLIIVLLKTIIAAKGFNFLRSSFIKERMAWLFGFFNELPFSFQYILFQKIPSVKHLLTSQFSKEASKSSSAKTVLLSVFVDQSLSRNQWKNVSTEHLSHAQSRAIETMASTTYFSRVHPSLLSVVIHTASLALEGEKSNSLLWNILQDKKLGEYIPSFETPTDLLHDGRNADIFFAVRNISPLCFRIIRTIIYSCMLVNSIATSNETTFAKIMSVLEKNWASVCELIGVTNEEKVNLLLFEIMESSQSLLLEDCSMSEQARNSWEEALQKLVLQVITSSEKHFERLNEMIYSGEVDTQLNEQLVKTIFQKPSLSLLPLDNPSTKLWIQEPAITYASIRGRFLANPQNKQLYPVLATFIEQEKKMMAVRYIPNIVKFQKILASHLSRRIDKNYARSHTVRDIINQFSTREQKELDKIFFSFAKGFNLGWQFVDLYDCVKLPEWCKTIEMNDQCSVSLCIPDEEDEFLCSSALLQFLIAEHNNFIEKVQFILSQKFEIENQSKKPSFKRKPSSFSYQISSRIASPYHLVIYDFEKEMGPFLKEMQIRKTAIYQSQQTQTISMEESLICDFGALEEWVIEKYFTGKPLIKYEVQPFSFLQSLNDTSSLTFLETIIPQKPLDEDVFELIVEELRTTERLRIILKQIQETISFLQDTCQGYYSSMTHLSQMRLADFVKNILLVTPEQSNMIQCQSIASHVQLCHLMSLYNMLESKLSKLSEIHSVITDASTSSDRGRSSSYTNNSISSSLGSSSLGSSLLLAESDNPASTTTSNQTTQE